MINKGVLKCGLLSVLFIIFGLSLVVSLDVKALKHEYVGIPYGSYTIPSPTYDSSTNKKYMDWSTTSTGGTYDGSGLYLDFEGDSYDSSYSSLSPKYSSSRLFLSYDSTINKCYYSDIYSIFRFHHGSTIISNDGFYTDIYAPFHSNYTNFTSPSEGFCRKVDTEFDSSTLDMNSIPAGLLSCNRLNGAVCGGLWNTREYVSSEILPYTVSSNGFYLKSKAVDVDGIHYSNTFSFNDMLNNYIPTFSKLYIPLHTDSGYFLDPENLYQGRQFEFDFHFEFDGSFEWHDNIDSNGSSISLTFQGMNLYSTDRNWIDRSYPCSANLITLPGESYTRLDITCNFTLDMSYVIITGPRLEINGNGNYVWKTDREWRFTDVFVVTDGDDTPGEPFNTNLVGGGTIPGDAKNNISSGTPDWLASLTNLFGFNLINPFAPIFNLFTDQNQCANIPTIASMIHSESSQVCPWFDSNTRNIVTPVLSLASAMLVFGFAVRWLGARSGNFFEDSTGEGVDSGGFHFGNKFRRRR